METYAIENEERLPRMTAQDRRLYPRTLSHTCCTVKAPDRVERYSVRNLSVCGALLIDGPLLPNKTKLVISLHMPLYPDVHVHAKVVRRGRDDEGRPFMGLAFDHRGDDSEDHIQAALLSEIERSGAHGRIADILA